MSEHVSKQIAKIAKKKQWKYNNYIKFTDVKTNQEFTLLTQLYEIGVYGIINGNSAMQGGYSPAQLEKMCKNIVKKQKEGKIKQLELGRLLTVIEDEHGLYKEINNDNT